MMTPNACRLGSDVPSQSSPGLFDTCTIIVYSFIAAAGGRPLRPALFDLRVAGNSATALSLGTIGFVKVGNHWLIDRLPRD
jgi:hypothetical protein